MKIGRPMLYISWIENDKNHTRRKIGPLYTASVDGIDWNNNWMAYEIQDASMQFHRVTVPLSATLSAIAWD